MNRKVDLSISCYGEVKDGRYDIVALPWGATAVSYTHLDVYKRQSLCSFTGR